MKLAVKGVGVIREPVNLSEVGSIPHHTLYSVQDHFGRTIILMRLNTEYALFGYDGRPVDSCGRAFFERCYNLKPAEVGASVTLEV